MIATMSEVVYCAVVRDVNGVQFSTKAPTPTARTSDLVAYIIERFDYTLWPAAAGQVRAQLRAGELDDAVANYFANVGSKWDEERLELSEIGSHTRAPNDIVHALD